MLSNEYRPNLCLRRKKKVVMKKVFVFYSVLLLGMLGCKDHNDQSANDYDCLGGNDIHQVIWPASVEVVDLTGLDGCGLAFKTGVDQFLIPERRVYITAPAPCDDPMYYAQLKAGDRVHIHYDITNISNACMAGRIVFVTYLKKVAL
jgi:hypothetical protein